jgi:hypothetical protein
MSLLNFESPKRRSGLGFKAIALVAIVTAILKVSGTFAANININAGQAVQFGQGMTALTACSGSNSLTLSPGNTFNSGSNAFNFSSLTVSGIPSSCDGSQFTISAYANTGNTPLAIYDTTATKIVINDTAGIYSVATGYSGISVSSASSGGTTSFTATFAAPVALGKDIYKFSIESSPKPASNNGSIYIDASSAIAYTNVPAFGAGAYTVEMWINLPSAPSGNSLIFAGSSSLGMYVQSNLSSFHIDMWGPGTGDHAFTFATPMSTNAWHHLVVVRNSSQLTQMFLDGVASSSGTYTDSNNYPAGMNSAFTTGAGSKIAGYLTNFRVTNTSVYSPSASSITVPTSPLTAIAGTQLLLSTTKSSPWADSSSNNSVVDHTGVTTSNLTPFP